MQEQHFDELKHGLSEELAKLIPAEEQRGPIRQKVAQAIDRMNEENKLLSLPEDEYKLLLDYRLWKSGPDAVGHVFHWHRK